MLGSLVEIPQSSLAGSDDLIVLKNALLAIDMGESSTRELRYALEIATRYEAKLHLFHCVDPAPFDILVPAQVSRACNDARKELEQLVSELRSQNSANIAEVNTIVVAGELMSLLAEAVNQNQIDLIIVGAHGRIGWRKALLGSVAETVIDQSECPVLVVAKAVEHTRDLGPKSILLAGDASVSLQPAGPYAISLARKFQSQLHVVDMVNSKGGLVQAQVSQLNWSDPLKDNTLATGQTSHDEMLINTDAQGDLILQLADQTAANLIVLSVPAGHKFSDRFESKNSYRVVSEARCPVLTVRSHSM
jgi:nucleotide-binding universal stress UspA family protein